MRPRARWARRPGTTSPILTAFCFYSIATPTASLVPIWCLPATPANELLGALAGAGADRRPRHPPATALDDPRQGGVAGGRGNAGLAHSALAARSRRPPRGAQPASPRRLHHPYRRRRIARRLPPHRAKSARRGPRIVGAILVGDGSSRLRRRPGARHSAARIGSIPDRQRRHADRRKST